MRHADFLSSSGQMQLAQLLQIHFPHSAYATVTPSALQVPSEQATL
jgi:hypothetical protein